MISARTGPGGIFRRLFGGTVNEEVVVVLVFVDTFNRVLHMGLVILQADTLGMVFGRVLSAILKSGAAGAGDGMDAVVLGAVVTRVVRGGGMDDTP